MANQTQPFKHHHIVRAFKAAEAAGVANPTVEVHLPGGATIVIGGGKADKAAPAIPKFGKAQSPSSHRSRRSP
jgi:hypothetical protein